jgi:hypothetical protein
MVPMEPEAPVLFSTTTGWPSSSLIDVASVRAITSAVPPGAYVMTILIGFVGKPCAWARGARGASASSDAASKRERRKPCMRESPG